MMAAAEFAALRLKDLPSANHKSIEIDHRDRVFRLLDKNGDGKISIEDLMEVMVELGAQGEDAREMMQLLDSNSDGSLSADEFDLFQKQVRVSTHPFLGLFICKVVSTASLSRFVTSIVVPFFSSKSSMTYFVDLEYHD